MLLYVISSWHTASIMFRHFVSLLCRCFSLLLTLTRLSANVVIEFSEPTSAMETLNLLRTFDFRLLAMRRFPFKESLPCKAYSTRSTPIIITTPKYLIVFCPLQALSGVKGTVSLSGAGQSPRPSESRQRYLKNIKSRNRTQARLRDLHVLLTEYQLLLLLRMLR